MLIIIVAGLILMYLLTIWFRNTFTFSPSVTRGLRILQLMALLVSIALFVLSYYNIYLRGYWAPRIIFWVWFFSAMVLYSFGDRKVFFKVEKLFYDILFFLPLTFFPLVMIPFVGGGIILLFYVAFIGDESMVLYSSDTIRIEQPYIRFMSPDPPIAVFRKDNLFSYKDTVIDIMYNEKLDSLRVEEISPDSIKLVYYNNTDNSDGRPAEEFSIRLEHRD